MSIKFWIVVTAHVLVAAKLLRGEAPTNEVAIGKDGNYVLVVTVDDGYVVEGID